MNVKSFELLYADAVRRYPRRFSFGEPPCSMKVVEAAESRLNVTFPSAFRTFLMTHGSGEIAFAVIYSPDPASYWNIVERNETILNRKQFYAFSDDQCGNYYGFACIGGERVYFFDHEIQEWIQSEYVDFYEYFSDISFRD